MKSRIVGAWCVVHQLNRIHMQTVVLAGDAVASEMVYMPGLMTGRHGKGDSST